MPDEAGDADRSAGEEEPGRRPAGHGRLLAARVEPDLLRRARLLVNADVAAESDLWWSDLVATQNSSGLVLEPSVADALRARLAAPDERDLRRGAWESHPGLPRGRARLDQAGGAPELAHRLG